MADEWYYQRSDQRIGPVSSQELKRLASAGELHPTDLLWKEGMPRPLAASQAQGLFTQPAQQATTPTAASPTPPSQQSSTAAVPADRKQLSQKIHQLRHDILQSVVGENSGPPSSPLLDEIRAQHRQLRDQVGKNQGRVQELSAAKGEYEPLEKTLAQKQKELADAESRLAGLARSLGHAAFEASCAGQVANQPCFAERIALRERIETLQKEYEQFAPPADASLLQKTKAKAQQLVVAGKIKMEELKIGGQETQIGKSLLESNAEQTVTCAATAALLDQIRQQRAMIAKLRTEEETTRAALESKRQELCGTLGLPSVENAGTFVREIHRCEGQIGQAQKELAAMEQEIPDRLAASPDAVAGPLSGLIGELRQANERLTLPGQKGAVREAIEAAGQAALDKTREFARTAVAVATSPQSRETLARMETTWWDWLRRHKVAGGFVGGGLVVVAIVAFSLSGRQARVAQRKAASQFIAVALKDAILVSRPDLLATAYAHIAKAQAKAGDAAGASQTLEKAKAAADKMSNDVNKTLPYRDIAEAQAKAGDVAGAKATAEKFSEEVEKVLAYRDIAEAQAQAGDTAVLAKR